MNKKTKIKILKKVPIILHIINIVLMIFFLVYLYFWVKARTK
ncbi:MAG TPA: hypothetical protein VJI97_03005 [Candidatus Nanoarchaeia archaeon]|nr:hypothetical protein [Candidatus Nanoarchaeia archaeon]